MAGSYNHIVDEDGKLLRGNAFLNQIENASDTYQMAVEMYGMIWFLANALNNTRVASADDRNYSELAEAEIVELAWKNYNRGIAESPGIAD